MLSQIITPVLCYITWQSESTRLISLVIHLKVHNVAPSQTGMLALWMNRRHIYIYQRDASNVIKNYFSDSTLINWKKKQQSIMKIPRFLMILKMQYKRSLILQNKKERKVYKTLQRTLKQTYVTSKEKYGCQCCSLMTKMDSLLEKHSK